MSPTADKDALGRRGERLAVRHLKKCGYTILRRNFRSPLGEIDVIAQEGHKVCFIEVKSRREHDLGRGKEAVGPGKQAKIVRAALGYLMKHNLVVQDCRFDVVDVSFDKSGRDPQVELIRDAFSATSFYNY